MLRLNEQEARITNVNIRCEKHGEEDVTGCDINATFKGSAKVLNMFSKNLMTTFFMDPQEAKQAKLPNTGEGETVEGPRLRHPGTFGAIPIDKDWPGYKAQIVWGDLASSVNVKLKAVRVKKIKVDPIDGGSCETDIQMQCHPDEDQYGKLALLLNKDVKLTLEPPSATELKKIEKEAEKKKDGPEDGEGNE